MLLTKTVTILAKHLEFIEFFLKKLVKKLLKYSIINKYIIDLKIDKQLPYKLIYYLRSIKLEILKTYIKINLVNGFIYYF